MPRAGTVNSDDIASWFQRGEAGGDLISPAAADQLAAHEYVHDNTGYAVIAKPVLDLVARSLTDTSQVLF